MPTPNDVIQRISLGETTENNDYAMASCRCSECGRVVLCISDPKGYPYKCRECYTGLTNAEIADRFKKLANHIGEFTTK